MLGLVHLFLQLGSEPTTLGKGSLLLINERKTPRERLFVALAWLPKATVQAAMGPLALDKARQALARRSSPQFLSPRPQLCLRYLEDNSGLSCEDLTRGEELLELCNMVISTTSEFQK